MTKEDDANSIPQSYFLERILYGNFKKNLLTTLQAIRRDLNIDQIKNLRLNFCPYSIWRKEEDLII